MMITVKSVKNRLLKRFLEHIVYVAIVLILIPGITFFELFIVLPEVVEAWTFQYWFHFVTAIFILFNVVGNMIFGVFTDTSIKGRILRTSNNPDWTYCEVCESTRPPRAWHCELCNICILKRDHHCNLLTCCVGYYNHRYYVMFTMYTFIAMLYAFCFNIYFVAQFITWNHGLVLIKFVLPLASFMLNFNGESAYILIVVLNVLVGLFTGFLTIYQFMNILKGKTMPESKNTNGVIYDRGWKMNLVEVFGARWYLTWILPFIHSRLPGNGIEWFDSDKHK